MVKIGIGFSKTDSWISRLIRWYEKSPVSHTFILFYDETLRAEMVLDVFWTGFRVLPYSRFKRDNQVVKVFDLKHDCSHGLRMVMRLAKCSYDWRAFIGFSRWWRRFLRFPADPQALLCSEMVVHLLQESGYPGAEKLIPKETSPFGLWRILHVCLFVSTPRFPLQGSDYFSPPDSID